MNFKFRIDPDAINNGIADLIYFEDATAKNSQYHAVVGHSDSSQLPHCRFDQKPRVARKKQRRNRSWLLLIFWMRRLMHSDIALSQTLSSYIFSLTIR